MNNMTKTKSIQRSSSDCDAKAPLKLLDLYIVFDSSLDSYALLCSER
jgi:hypothetical protein